MRVLIATATICLFSSLVFGQQLSRQASSVPAELQALNPDVRAKLAAARSDSQTGKYDEAFEEDQQALDIAKKAGFSADIALAEDTLASAEFISGRVQAGWDLDRDAFQKAIESSNFVLQADILTSLSSYSQSAGNLKGALSLLAQALDAAEKSKNLYIRSRVLGEFGRLQLLGGQKEEAKKALEEALRIDSLNSYAFHSLHLVYQAYFLLSDDQTVKQGIQELEKARDAAVSDRNYLALVLAESALGASYVHIGDPQRGIDILRSMNSGDIKVGSGTQVTQAEFRAVLKLPYIRASLLEALGNAYETAKRTSDAIGAWTELYSFSSGIHMTPANAEAAQHLANLYATQGDNENAAKYYQIAASQWQASGNDAMLLQSLGGEAVSLSKTGRSVEALAVENQIAQCAIQQKNRRAEFLAYLAMAEIYQPANQMEDAKTSLEKAQALIDPGPGDPTLGYQTVAELYLRLGAVYEKLGDQEKQLAATEKALAVSIAAKDQPQINTLVGDLRKKFNAIHLEDLISRLYKQGQFSDALIYSQLSYFFNGAPAGSKADLVWQIILNTPFQIVAQQGGDQQLEQDLQLMGPLLKLEKLPILQALAQNLVFSGKDPIAAREYSLQALALIDASKPSMESFRLRSICTLAVAYARTNSPDLGRQTIQTCMDLEKRSTDDYERKLANVANIFFHALENDIGGAQSSLDFLKQNAGDDPARDEELALVLGSGGHTPDAIFEFEAALRSYQNRNDLTSSARCYKEMASVLDSSTSPDSKKKQLQFLNEALSLYKRTGDGFQEAGTDLAIAQYFAKLNNTSEAEHYFEQALQTGERSGNETAIGWANVLFGSFYAANKQPEKALMLHNAAAIAFRAAKDKHEEANATLAAGLDLQSMGQVDQALTSYFKAQTLADESGQSSSRYFAQTDIGFLYERKGQMEQARTAFVKAGQIAESAHDLGNSARCDLDLAGLDSLEGDWLGALDHTTKALTIFQQIGDGDGESDADEELANIYSDRTSTVQDFEMARKYFALAQKLHHSQTTELDEIEIDIQTKQFAQAVATAKNALAACRQKHGVWDNGQVCAANALISLAEAERLSGDFKASATALEQAKPLVGKNEDIYLRGRLLYGEANQERAMGHSREAVGFYKQAIQLIEEAKGNIDPESQLAMADTYDFVYDELVDCLYSLSEQEKGPEKLHATVEALTYAETNKARQFANSWGQAFVSELREKLPLDVLQEEDVLIARRNQLAAQLQARISGTDNSSASAADLQKQLANAKSDFQDFVRMLDSKYPDYAALKYPQAITLADIPIRAGETLVEFKMTDTATFVWIIRSDAANGNSLISFYKVPEQRAWFDSQISKLRDAFNSGQPEGYDPAVSEELFGKLFPGKQAEAILESHRLIFVPDDVLDLLPFELLSPHAAQNQYVLLSVPTVYFPSAEALRIGRTARRSEHWQNAFLGVGDPITSPSDPRYSLVTALSSNQSGTPRQIPATVPQSAPDQLDKLKARGFEFDPIPGTAKEIESIASLFSESHESTDILLDVKATRKDLLDLDLSKFRYIHFATHGILPVDAGVREPSLVLSYDGNTTDQMLLPISTIMRLNIDADSVVLSACNTGSGQVTRAEGVMSLGRAFMTAGASSVTVSLWEVSDESTALFMKQYYRDLLVGKSKGEALAEARTWLFQNGYRQPYFWAPFILTGE